MTAKDVGPNRNGARAARSRCSSPTQSQFDTRLADAASVAVITERRIGYRTEKAIFRAPPGLTVAGVSGFSVPPPVMANCETVPSEPLTA